MQRARAPTMLLGGQRATILQPASRTDVQPSATRIVRPGQQPILPQTPVRMVS